MKNTFKEYYDFIYLNTNLPKNDAYKIARDCWNEGLDKQSALAKARGLYIKEVR